MENIVREVEDYRPDMMVTYYVERGDLIYIALEGQFTYGVIVYSISANRIVWEHDMESYSEYFESAYHNAMEFIYGYGTWGECPEGLWCSDYAGNQTKVPIDVIAEMYGLYYN